MSHFPDAPAALAAEDAVAPAGLHTLLDIVRSIFARPAHRDWYCKAAGCEDPETAAEHFVARSQTEDITPVRLFDPAWFRAHYRVEGVNSFASYIANERQRLAWPSQLFAPRWYARRHRIERSRVHPFLHYLLSEPERSPHPLIDVDHLKAQSTSWRAGSVAVDFLDDPTKHRLNPHPLFDSAWYLDRNPDVAQSECNPLVHYLWFGHAEGRQPNRIFDVVWYRNTYVRRGLRQLGRLEPLTDYTARGFFLGRVPGPGLIRLLSPSVRQTEHGPEPLLRSLSDNRSLYAAIRHRPEATSQRHDPAFALTQQNPQFLPDVTLLLRRCRLALMFTPKCASAAIVYWWLEQLDLLSTLLRFSAWSHDGLALYRNSEEYIEDALTFDPAHYRLFKFVRNPILRAVSSFSHFLFQPHMLQINEQSGIRAISFLEFLDRLEQTDFGQGEHHMAPQLTGHERRGTLRPAILKVEDGLDRHLARLEREFGLPAADPWRYPQVRLSMRRHTLQPQAMLQVGPAERIKFSTGVPRMRELLTSASIGRIYQVYREDFEAYGYRPAI